MLEVYNFLTPAYQPKQNRSHANGYKELNNIYNRIRSISSQSPLFKLNITGHGQTYALGIKDTALSLKYRLEDYQDEKHSAFLKKQIHSDAPQIADVKLLSDDTSSIPDEFFLQVLQLAASQINESIPLASKQKAGFHGTYGFSITLDDTPYHFKLQLDNSNTNKKVLDNLSDFINKASIGLYANVKPATDPGMVKLTLQSKEIGSAEEDRIFTLEGTPSKAEPSDLVSYLGLNNMVVPPKNSLFTIDGKKKESLSNTFTLYHNLLVTLKSVSEDSVRIYFLPEEEGIYKDVKQTLDTYNHLVDFASANKNNRRSQKLLHELATVSKKWQEELDSCGIQIGEGYHLISDESKVRSSIQDGRLRALFTQPDGFGVELAAKASAISLNPMDYLDKLIVTYPNIKNSFSANPYLTSIYTGMLFNFYC